MDYSEKHFLQHENHKTGRNENWVRFGFMAFYLCEVYEFFRRYFVSSSTNFGFPKLASEYGESLFEFLEFFLQVKQRDMSQRDTWTSGTERRYQRTKNQWLKPLANRPVNDSTDHQQEFQPTTTQGLTDHYPKAWPTTSRRFAPTTTRQFTDHNLIFRPRTSRRLDGPSVGWTDYQPMVRSTGPKNANTGKSLTYRIGFNLCSFSFVRFKFFFKKPNNLKDETKKSVKVFPKQRPLRKRRCVGVFMQTKI